MIKLSPPPRAIVADSSASVLSSPASICNDKFTISLAVPLRFVTRIYFTSLTSIEGSPPASSAVVDANSATVTSFVADTTLKE